MQVRFSALHVCVLTVVSPSMAECSEERRPITLFSMLIAMSSCGVAHTIDAAHCVTQAQLDLADRNLDVTKSHG